MAQTELVAYIDVLFAFGNLSLKDNSFKLFIEQVANSVGKENMATRNKAAKNNFLDGFSTRQQE